MCSMWSSGVQIFLFTRSWTRHVAEEKQERARVAADQQQVAEQHHRQVLVKGMWEGLGQAVALSRLAHRDAHRHLQLYRQRQVAAQRCLTCSSICSALQMLFRAVTAHISTPQALACSSARHHFWRRSAGIMASLQVDAVHWVLCWSAAATATFARTAVHAELVHNVCIKFCAHAAEALT